VSTSFTVSIRSCFNIQISVLGSSLIIFSPLIQSLENKIQEISWQKLFFEQGQKSRLHFEDENPDFGPWIFPPYILFFSPILDFFGMHGKEGCLFST
jgi:hypothetical protein